MSKISTARVGVLLFCVNVGECADSAALDWDRKRIASSELSDGVRKSSAKAFQAETGDGGSGCPLVSFRIALLRLHRRGKPGRVAEGCLPDPPTTAKFRLNLAPLCHFPQSQDAQPEPVIPVLVEEIYQVGVQPAVARKALRRDL